MNNKIKSLAFLVNLGIYGVASPAFAAETTSNKDVDGETMVVTAAEQNLQVFLLMSHLLRNTDSKRAVHVPRDA